MHAYRTHTCGELNIGNANTTVKLSGWINNKRKHGFMTFIDLRDHYGIVQCVIDTNNPLYEQAIRIPLESVITITGLVVTREADANNKLATGQIEVQIQELNVISQAEELPLQVNSDAYTAEENRLRFRYLDLRRSKMHQNIVLRSKVISSLRKLMIEQGFNEFQTPILTSSSPEGARDYLVPSRVHPGKFYALPQAPQQFKQLLMVAGFDRYFQIAPCFRDEDGRADRSPGEFYQLDFEMSFVTQEDVFNAIEPVLYKVFKEYSGERKVYPMPFPRIPYKEAMLKYGSDKPDLRNPLVLIDLTERMKSLSNPLFAEDLAAGFAVRAIRVPAAGDKPRSFMDKLTEAAHAEGCKKFSYVILKDDMAFKGAMAKHFNAEETMQVIKDLDLQINDALFVMFEEKSKLEKVAGKLRNIIGESFELIEPNCFKFCWITDFPMYEINSTTGKVDFSHNPFSMPQGGLQALNSKDPLEINAFQYDIVCNGIELSSGAIRNHLPEVMIRAFEIAGYSAQEVENRFGGMLNAFRYGAPPHGGSAPGIDRIVMLLADEQNIREIVAFPMNQSAEDLLMQAPAPIDHERLKELHIKLDLGKDKTG